MKKYRIAQLSEAAISLETNSVEVSTPSNQQSFVKNEDLKLQQSVKLSESESEILASGSVNGFINGKHFNRCKRLHPLMVLGLQILHFKSFLDQENMKLEDIDEKAVSDLKAFQDDNSVPLTENEELLNLLKKYSDYQDATIKGDFGKTAQFYMTYVQLVHHYLNFSRSIRMGDFDLFKYMLPKITNLFFIFNQPNYARWLTKYHNNLMQVDQTHPGLKQDLLKGCFGVKRTDKPFSRQPIDLALEQTINADAGRRLTGISHITNSISARQRWALSHSIRSAVISHVYEECGLKTCQDVTGDLQPNRIMQSSTQLKKFIHTIEQYINPFDKDLYKDQLYNIVTGCAASQKITEFLLNVEENGNNLRETFIFECVSKPERFEKPIKRNNILNFAQNGEIKNVRVANKVHELRMQRDLFGRMLAVSLQQNIDIEKILSYPLTPVPMSMCHLDGKIYKTDKSVLSKLLEKKIESEAPKNIDIVILDGFFVLHLIKDIPKSFGNLSKKFLQMITRYDANRIDIIFDRYFSPSIKDIERLRRDESHNCEYAIHGPDQVRPTDFGKALRNNKFKEALVEFLMTHWASEEMAPFFGRKIIHFNYEHCYRFEAVGGKVVKTREDTLSCGNHEEADTKIIHHVCQNINEANILIKCSDTDILIILLGNIEHACSRSNIWIESGVGNNMRYIDVTKLHQHLGDSLSASLPGFHALTGCDYNSAFFRKGKKRPFKMLETSLKFQDAFARLGDLMTIDTRTELFSTLEEFVCQLYGVKNVSEVNKAKFLLFSNTYQAKTINEPFQLKLKNCDASSLPPCQTELHQHLLRAQYITSVWRNAHLKNPTTLHPYDCGWTNNNGKYDLVWFAGPQFPPTLSEIVLHTGNDEDKENITESDDVDTDIDDDECSDNNE